MGGLFGALARFIKIVRLTFLQSLVRNIVTIKRSRFFSPSTQPDAWKVIANRTDLYSSRVFKPKLKDAGTVPLLIMCHGGGFVMNLPATDDPLARFLAEDCNCIVINIDYRKAPSHRFPSAYDDVVESVLALLGDGGDDLPIDLSKVILCGSSAGGNLVLAAAQDNRLRGKLLGIVAIYPAVNFVPTMEEQMARRPDPSVPDFLGDMWNDVLDIYVGTNDVKALQDTRLSPTNFKQRDDLPKYVFMSGCEHDMLCYEAEIMAEKLADADALPKKLTADGWHAGGVCWWLAKGQTHAFDHFAKKAEEEEVTRLCEKWSMYQGIASWLKDVFTTT